LIPRRDSIFDVFAFVGDLKSQSRLSQERETGEEELDESTFSVVDHSYLNLKIKVIKINVFLHIIMMLFFQAWFG
jgi:hypothetical protein